MVAVLLALLAAAVAGIVVWGYNPIGRWRLRHLPGPKPDWLLGNMRQLGNFGKSHETQQQWAAKYGPCYRYFLGRQPCVVLSDPELVRQVAVKRFMSFHDRPQSAIRNGGARDALFQDSGILFATGRHWLGIRTACEPLFHSAALSAYAPMMNGCIDQLLDRLQAVAGSGQGVNVSELLKEMSLDVIGITAFGVDFKAQKEGLDSQLVAASERMFTPTGGMPLWAVFMCFAAPGLKVLAYNLAAVLGGDMLRDIVACRRYLWGASQALLDRARKGAGNTQATDASTADCGGSADSKPGGDGGGAAAGGGVRAARLDRSMGETFQRPEASSAFRRAYKEFSVRTPPPTSIVSRLKDAVNKQTGEALSDLDICAQLFTFLLAGYETTSLALSYTLYLLAKHPDIQQRARAEVDALGDGPIAYEDLPKLAYTEACFLEAMRMYPPVSALLALSRTPKDAAVDIVLPAKDGGSDTVFRIPGKPWRCFVPPHRRSPIAGSAPTVTCVCGARVFVLGAACPPLLHAAVCSAAGSRVGLSIYTIHHDPKHYPDPETFRPERFLAGSAEAAARHPGAYFPFGLGPRKCVGYRFAQEEGVLCLARLLRRFDLQLDPERHTGPLDLHTSVTIVPQGGIWLRVSSRE
ncbi:hypothetical protein ABPG77_003440 [Micractinium sp. CCAP 211/92]